MRTAVGNAAKRMLGAEGCIPCNFPVGSTGNLLKAFRFLGVSKCLQIHSDHCSPIWNNSVRNLAGVLVPKPCCQKAMSSHENISSEWCPEQGHFHLLPLFVWCPGLGHAGLLVLGSRCHNCRFSTKSPHLFIIQDKAIGDFLYIYQCHRATNLHQINLAKLRTAIPFPLSPHRCIGSIWHGICIKYLTC